MRNVLEKKGIGAIISVTEKEGDNQKTDIRSEFERMLNETPGVKYEQGDIVSGTSCAY